MCHLFAVSLEKVIQHNSDEIKTRSCIREITSCLVTSLRSSRRVERNGFSLDLEDVKIRPLLLIFNVKNGLDDGNSQSKMICGRVPPGDETSESPEDIGENENVSEPLLNFDSVHQSLSIRRCDGAKAENLSHSQFQGEMFQDFQTGGRCGSLCARV